jgi:hypothetical protein
LGTYGQDAGKPAHNAGYFGLALRLKEKGGMTTWIVRGVVQNCLKLFGVRDGGGSSEQRSTWGTRCDAML